MLTVVSFKWKSPSYYRSTFGPETVNVLRRMLMRHVSQPFRFVCVTDDPVGLEPDIETMPIWTDYADVPSPHGGKNPSCYRRLKLFSPKAAKLFGPRILSIDLDCVITASLDPLLERDEPIVFWGDTNPKTHYNGSMILMDAGCRPQVWERFDPTTSPREAMASGCFGSDQGWISYVLGAGEARWRKTDGVYSFRNDIRPRGGSLPSDARIVFFHGEIDPWSPRAQRLEWVQQHWT